MICFCWILAGISIVGILLSIINFCKNKDLYKAEKISDLLKNTNNEKLKGLLEEELDKIFPSKNNSEKST